MSKPVYRLPMLNSLRSNDGLSSDVIDTPYGPIPSPIYDHLVHAKANGRKSTLKAIATEAESLARFTEHLIGTMPVERQPQVKSVPQLLDEIDGIIANASYASSGFNVESLPAWVRHFVADLNVEPLLELTQAQADEQMTVVCAVIKDVRENGKVSWLFASNSDKRGYAFVPRERLRDFAVGQAWVLKHNGKSGLDSKVEGGIQVSLTHLEEVSQVLTKVWRKYH